MYNPYKNLFGMGKQRNIDPVEMMQFKGRSTLLHTGKNLTIL